MSGNSNQIGKLCLCLDDNWLLCESNTHPGHSYCYNVVTRQSVWTSELADYAAQMTNCQPNIGSPSVTDPCINTPEKPPTDTRDDNLDPMDVDPANNDMALTPYIPSITSQLENMRITELPANEEEIQQYLQRKYFTQLDLIYRDTDLLKTVQESFKIWNIPVAPDDRQDVYSQLNIAPSTSTTAQAETSLVPRLVYVASKDEQGHKTYSKTQRPVQKTDLKKGKKVTFSDSIPSIQISCPGRENPRTLDVKDYFGTDSEDDSDAERMVEFDHKIRIVELAPLRKVALPCDDSCSWYLVVDLYTLLNDFLLITSLTDSDDECFLMIPERVMIQLDEYNHRSNNIATRRLMKHLCHQIKIGHFFMGEEPNVAENLSYAASILTTCLQLTEENYHVILITHDSDILAHRELTHVNIFSSEEVKSIINWTKYLNRHNAVVARTKKFKKYRSKMPIPENEQLANWNNRRPNYFEERVLDQQHYEARVIEEPILVPNVAVVPNDNLQAHVPLQEVEEENEEIEENVEVEENAEAEASTSHDEGEAAGQGAIRRPKKSGLKSEASCQTELTSREADLLMRLRMHDVDIGHLSELMLDDDFMLGKKKYVRRKSDLNGAPVEVCYNPSGQNFAIDNNNIQVPPRNPISEEGELITISFGDTSEFAQGEASSAGGTQKRNNYKIQVPKGYLDGIDTHDARVKVITQVESQVERSISICLAEGVEGIEIVANQLEILRQTVIEEPCTEAMMLHEMKRRLDLLFEISNMRATRPRKKPDANVKIASIKSIRLDSTRIIQYVTVATDILKSLIHNSKGTLPRRTQLGGTASFNFLLNFIRLCNHIHFPFDRKQGPTLNEIFDVFFDLKMPEVNNYYYKVREISLEINHLDIEYAFGQISNILAISTDGRDKMRDLTVPELKFLSCYGMYIVEVIKQRWLAGLESTGEVAQGPVATNQSAKDVVQGALEGWFSRLVHDNPDSVAIYVLAARDMLIRFSQEYDSVDSASMALIVAAKPGLLTRYLRTISKRDRAICASGSGDAETSANIATSSKAKKKHRRKKAKMTAAAAAILEAEKARKAQEAALLASQQQAAAAQKAAEHAAQETAQQTDQPADIEMATVADTAMEVETTPTPSTSSNTEEKPKPKPAQVEVSKKEKRKNRNVSEPIYPLAKKLAKSQAPKAKPVVNKTTEQKKKAPKQQKKGSAKDIKKYTGRQTPRHDTWSSNSHESRGEGSRRGESSREARAQVPSEPMRGTRDRGPRTAARESIGSFYFMMDMHFKELRQLLDEAKRFCDRTKTEGMSDSEKITTKAQFQTFRDEISKQCSELEGVINQVDSADNNSVRIGLTSGGVNFNCIETNVFEHYRQPIISCRKRADALDDQLATLIANI